MTGPGGRNPSHDLIWNHANTFCDALWHGHYPQKKMPAAQFIIQYKYIFSMSSVERMTRTSTWVMIICRPTRTLLLVLSISLFLSIALASLDLSLLFVSLGFSLFHTHIGTTRFLAVVRGMWRSVGYKIVDTSVLETLNFWMFWKLDIYCNTHPAGADCIVHISDARTVMATSRPGSLFLKLVETCSTNTYAF